MIFQTKDEIEAAVPKWELFALKVIEGHQVKSGFDVAPSLQEACAAVKWALERVSFLENRQTELQYRNTELVELKRSLERELAKEK